jgi:hypothetical protein
MKMHSPSYGQNGQLVHWLVLVHSNQKRKLAIWGAMKVDVQSAKGTKTLDPRAGKNTHWCKVLCIVLKMTIFWFYG